MTEWVKCTEKLPKNGKYLVSFNEDISTAHFWNSEFYIDSNLKVDATITHWAELPKTPKQIEKERQEYLNSDYCRFLTGYVDRYLKRFSDVNLPEHNNESS